MKDLYRIRGLKYVTYSCGYEGNPVGNATHYEVEKNGTVRIYATDYHRRKHLNSKNYKLPTERIETFFNEVSEIIEDTVTQLMLLDDCARKWSITFNNFSMEINGDFETEDGRRIEDAFNRFIALVREQGPAENINEQMNRNERKKMSKIELVHGSCRDV